MFDDYAENQSHPSRFKIVIRRPHFGKKKILGLICLSLAIFGFLIGSEYVKATHFSNIYSQTIWEVQTLNDATLPQWKQSNISLRTASPCTTFSPCLSLNPNSTFPAIALSQTPFSIDTVASHNLLIDDFKFYDFINLGLSNTQHWGWFLTRNGTLPLTSFYSPWSDPNVALIVWVSIQPGAQLLAKAFIQLDPNKPISSGDFSCGEQTVYICSTLITAHWNHAALGFSNVWNLALNFTGSPHTTGQTGASILSLGNVLTGSTCADDYHACSYKFPPLQFQGQSYFMGLWGETGGSSVFINGHVAVLRADFSPVCGATVTCVDTGGFFGPLIRAFITLREIFITVFNTIGQSLGLGNIGTATASFFNGLVNWFANVLGPAFGQLSNLASMAASTISFLGNFFLIAPLIGFIALLASAWATISGGFDLLNMLMVSGAIGLSYFFVFNYIYGMFRMYREGMDGFQKWLNLNLLIVFGLFRAGNIFAQLAIDTVLKVKWVIFEWL